MAEMERGHPDELTQKLKNWLREARDPLGSLQPGVDPEEWAVRRFIESWRETVHSSITVLEEILADALDKCRNGGSREDIAAEIESARSQIQEGLREELGLLPWHE